VVPVIMRLLMNKEQLKKLEDDLWKSADSLRANSDLKSSEYSTCVLGIIFLKFADNNYRKHEAEIKAEYEKLKGSRREKEISEIAIEKCGFYLPDHARYNFLLELPEQEDIVKAIKAAMASIEEYKPELQGVLPQDEYFRFNRTDQNKAIPKRLLKLFADIPVTAGGDIFGQIYEYFLGNFALAEGQGGGEFFTPRSVVQLMVEIIEPHRGKVFDPACGSGGMFVQSAKFINEHREELKNGADAGDLFVYGQEKTLETVKLAKMNIAVNGLRGEVRQTNSYYEDPFDSFGQFDYVLANPPFNVDDVALSGVEKDKRFNTYGLPRNKSKTGKKDQGKETVPNGNYLWINLFATSLKPEGRAALVMANSASDARHSEADIRKTLIENNLIYGMLTLPSNMFYTVTLPATLWFFDKSKTDERILFIDARNIFTQIDRAHREFSDAQVQNIAIISHLRKGHRDRYVGLIDQYFEHGVAKLIETEPKVKPIAEELASVLDAPEGKAAVSDFLKQWKEVAKLSEHYQHYLKSNKPLKDIAKKNSAQIELRERFDPFFEKLHSDLKVLDKAVRSSEKAVTGAANGNGTRGSDKQLKGVKGRLAELHAEMRSAEEFFRHIAWLQERFPNAEYEDVTGLCKLATVEEVKEQDSSLNPGRYVGVVIEEDGRTEEEFEEEVHTLHSQLDSLTKQASVLAVKISDSIDQLLGGAK
jgi:type I restriction enzyme M protein